VLGVRAAWHGDHPKEHGQLIRALSQAEAWLADPENREVAVEILASKRYVNTPKTVVEGALADMANRELAGVDPMSLRFLGGGPNTPSRAHTQWYLEQMIRYGHVDLLSSARLDVTSICLERFYEESLTGLIAYPAKPALIGFAAASASERSSESASAA